VKRPVKPVLIVAATGWTHLPQQGSGKLRNATIFCKRDNKQRSLSVDAPHVKSVGYLAAGWLLAVGCPCMVAIVPVSTILLW
jgi:hypothetical protein